MYLLGASGHAKVLIDIAKSSGLEVDGLYDKDITINALQGYAVQAEDKIRNSDQLLIAIGDNTIRKKLSEQYVYNAFATLLHPSAVIDRTVKIGRGTVAMAGVVINTDTVLGNHVIVNTSASVDHDCHIADYVHIAPNATVCGGITIGEGTFVGAGAVIIPNITIGKWVTIGAGAVVINDVPDGATAVGNPAKIVKTMSN